MQWWYHPAGSVVDLELTLLLFQASLVSSVVERSLCKWEIRGSNPRLAHHFMSFIWVWLYKTHKRLMLDVKLISISLPFISWCFLSRRQCSTTLYTHIVCCYTHIVCCGLWKLGQPKFQLAQLVLVIVHCWDVLARVFRSFWAHLQVNRTNIFGDMTFWWTFAIFIMQIAFNISEPLRDLFLLS